MKQFIKKIVIITGITSFLGRSVAKYLLSKGFIVYGIIRPESKSINKVKDIKGINLINLNFNNETFDSINKVSYTTSKEVVEKIKNCNIDITFIHFGWGATLDRANRLSQEQNIEYSKKVLEFAKVLGVKRFIFAGSQAEIYGSEYGKAKKAFGTYGEKNCRKNIDFIHLRIFSVYGSDDRETTLIKSLIKSIKENIPIDLSSCNYMWNFLFIDDFVKIIYKLIICNARTGIYDIASDDTRLLKDYVIEAYNVLKGKNELRFGARPDSKEKFAIPDINNTLKIIGDFKFIKFCKGIKKV